MKYIVTGNNGECEMFEFKGDAGVYLQEQGYGQDAETGFDLRDFSPEDLFDAVKSQPIGPARYWHVEEVAEHEAAARFLELQDLVEKIDL